MQLEAQHGANADSCRARVLASALVVETAVGLTYFFPLYSESLKVLCSVCSSCVAPALLLLHRAQA